MFFYYVMKLVVRKLADGSIASSLHRFSLSADARAAALGINNFLLSCNKRRNDYIIVRLHEIKIYQFSYILYNHIQLQSIETRNLQGLKVGHHLGLGFCRNYTSSWQN